LSDLPTLLHYFIYCTCSLTVPVYHLLFNQSFNLSIIHAPTFNYQSTNLLSCHSANLFSYQSTKKSEFFSVYNCSLSSLLRTYAQSYPLTNLPTFYLTCLSTCSLTILLPTVAPLQIHQLLSYKSILVSNNLLGYPCPSLNSYHATNLLSCQPATYHPALLPICKCILFSFYPPALLQV
jgi:hypothetical protein